MTTKIEQWIQDEDAAMSSHDVEKILSLYSDECVYEDLAIGKINKGKEEIRSFLIAGFTAFPDFKVEIKSFFGSNDRICIEGIISGTYKGDIPGLPPANEKSFAVQSAHIVTLSNDKAIHVTDYYDNATVMRQLGILSNP